MKKGGVFMSFQEFLYVLLSPFMQIIGFFMDLFGGGWADNPWPR